jgi:hypothetical protein
LKISGSKYSLTLHIKVTNNITVNFKIDIKRSGMLQIIQALFLTWTLSSYRVLIELMSPNLINLAKPVKRPT